MIAMIVVAVMDRDDRRYDDGDRRYYSKGGHRRHDNGLHRGWYKNR